MTYNPNLDRTDWRARDDRELIEAARDSGHELAIALGERLDDFAGMDDALADAQASASNCKGRCDALRRELEELHDALAADAEGAARLTVPALLFALAIALLALILEG